MENREIASIGGAIQGSTIVAKDTPIFGNRTYERHPYGVPLSFHQGVALHN